MAYHQSLYGKDRGAPVSLVPLIFYHAPHTRSGDVLALLEELQTPYELKLLNLRSGDQRKPGYLALNPMGKVPCIVHGDTVVTEAVAIFIYLADLFPGAKLAPAIGDPLRGSYLRWLVYYSSCFEPALQDHEMKHKLSPPHTCFYGDYERVVATVTGQLEKHAYIAGDTFTAADIIWGSVLNWLGLERGFTLTPKMRDYAMRIVTRPAIVAARAKDEEYIAQFKAAYKKET